MAHTHEPHSLLAALSLTSVGVLPEWQLWAAQIYVTVGFDFLCVPIAQTLNLASSSVSLLRDRKEAFAFAAGSVPAWGKI